MMIGHILSSSSMMASSKRKQDEKNLKLLRELASQPFNKKCFDCGQRGPTYVNMTIGSFVCTSCSGILRGLNPPQRVKSISMTSFNPQEIEFLQGAGNEMCKKTWLGLWNSTNSPEPESRDEQKVKDFMIQKYERRRWYIPPQQVTSSSSTNSVPEAKPLKQLLGKDIPTIQSSSQVHNTTRERPRTASQSSLPSAVPPPVSSVINEPQPTQQKPATSLDLLSDLGGDPFAQPNQPSQGFVALGAQPQQPPQSGSITGFDPFSQSQPASQAPFDPFGSSQPQPVQSVPSGFAHFSQPQQQTQPLQQQASFDDFAVFASPVSSAQIPQSSASGLGHMVSATSSSEMPAANPAQQASDKYAALSVLDSLFYPSSSTSNSSVATHTSTSSGGSVFGSNSSATSLGMSTGPNPFASGGHQPSQPTAHAVNPFQGLGDVGGSAAGFIQMNGPGRSMSPASNSVTGITSSASFGSFSSALPSSTSFGQPAAQQPQALSAWGSMGGMSASSAAQNLSFGGASTTIMAANQFGKVPNQSNPMGSQVGVFGGGPASGIGGGQGIQSSFGGGAQMVGSGMGTPVSSANMGHWGQSSSFATQPGGQSSQSDGFGNQSSGFAQQSGFGAQQGGFGAQQSGFAAPQSGLGMQQGGFAAQPGNYGAQRGGFGPQQGQFPGQQQGRFPGQVGAGGAGFGGQTGGFGSGGGMMGQFGQPQQHQQQFGGWGQQSSQPNPFMGLGQPQMQQQSNNPFM